MSIRDTFYNSTALLVINSIMARLPCCLLMGLLKQDFLDIYLTTFSGSVILEIQNLWRHLFSKGSRFNLHLKNGWRNWGNVFCFWDKCIWIGCVKLPQLRTWYLSSGANVLTSSPKIFHVNNSTITVINKYDKVAVIKISTAFGCVYLVASTRLLWNGTF